MAVSSLKMRGEDPRDSAMENTQTPTQVRRNRVKRSHRSNRSWRAVGIGAAVLMAFVLTASAATLGGLGSSGLGADDTVVASCDNDGVTIDYTVVYDATDGRFEVDSADISGIAAACVGQTLDVALRDGSGTLLDSGSGTVSGASESISMTNVSAEAVEAASVAVIGVWNVFPLGLGGEVEHHSQPF